MKLISRLPGPLSAVEWRYESNGFLTVECVRLHKNGPPQGWISLVSKWTLFAYVSSNIVPYNQVSFAGLGFLTLFIAGRLNVLDTCGQIWKTVIALAPLVTAGIIAISRLMDNRYIFPIRWTNNRHHPFDVLFGSSLGYLLAWMAYRQYFPAISTAEGGRPYSIAEFATETAGPVQAHSTSSEPDLELGEARQRNRVHGTGGWEDAETNAEDVPRNGPLKLGTGDELERETIPGQRTVTDSFDGNTESRR